MRDRLREALIDSEYIETEASKPDFLVYLMGPYKSYPPYESSASAEVAAATTRPTLDEIDRQLEEGTLDLDVDEALALLLALKRDLREQTGVNAFLATDPEIPLEEMDAATQSIEYTKAATATIFVAPAMGDNLGVGIETGSVCEHVSDAELRTDVAFYGEQNVESAMIKAVSARWHITVDDFESYADLFKAIRAHLRTVA
ncbi:hypothetical protein [Saliphagus sp. LR7]|uniref:DUF7509 family protein n=1 Tax=Saliphagus sp. LR7 TaxID=2282654 RepID=UPI000DF747C2|nr:hypothetical protein [Saliphagus sp. LR7]